MGFPGKNTGVGCNFLLQGIKSASPALSGGFFPAEPPGTPPLHTHIYALTLRLEEIQYLWCLKWHQNPFSNGTFSSLANHADPLRLWQMPSGSREEAVPVSRTQRWAAAVVYSPWAWAFHLCVRSQRFLCWQGNNVHLPVQGSLLRALFHTWCCRRGIRMLREPPATKGPCQQLGKCPGVWHHAVPWKPSWLTRRRWGVSLFFLLPTSQEASKSPQVPVLLHLAFSRASGTPDPKPGVLRGCWFSSALDSSLLSSGMVLRVWWAFRGLRDQTSFYGKGLLFPPNRLK